ncbi:hypothetical protein WAF17_06310 [Bernardetia sp. ABR2-2B]|uniref:hypothetical protein n=1 Tax=Bernardetia sp. ABR2-2B TaxID=3127472 RepID=UPI0030CB1C2E
MDIEFYDITDTLKSNLELQGKASVKIGNGYNYSDSNDFQNLDDTLFISHPDYVFDTLPMNYHDFTFQNDAILLKIYSKPFYKRYYEQDFNIARRKKTKNDSITLKVFYVGYGDSPKITLYLDNDKRYIFEKSKHHSENGFYYHTLPYDELTDGKFKVESEGEIRIFPFKANQWYQTNYITPVLVQQPSEREKRLIQSYFDYVKNSQKKALDIKNSSVKEKDSLISVIHELRGEIPPPLPPIEEEIEEQVFTVVGHDAYPMGGFKSFFKGMQSNLSKHAKYAGNITVELTILRNGDVQVKPLHRMSDSDELYFTLLLLLRERKWIQGHRISYTQKVILSINFTAN